MNGKNILTVDEKLAHVVFEVDILGLSYRTELLLRHSSLLQ